MVSLCYFENCKRQRLTNSALKMDRRENSFHGLVGSWLTTSRTQTGNEGPSHPSENGCYQENKVQQMLMRVGVRVFNNTM